MSIKLRELIRNVRACKTAAEERSVIAKECALCRTAFKSKDNEFRHRNVAKLLYIHMLGYPTHFGQMESVKLIASARFPEKRIGYLGLMVLLDERQKVLMLITNQLKIDFMSTNQYIVGLALCALGNISSQEIARDLSSEVEKKMRDTNPYVRKKAALCATRIIRKCHDLIEDFLPAVGDLLNDKNHSVILTGVTLIIEMIKIDPNVTEGFRKLVPQIVRLLKNLVLAGYVSDYDVVGITDPFLQIKLIQLLRLLGTASTEASEQMNDILAQVAINTEPTKNPGNAILYETVMTIMSIEAEGGLRVLAINILGRFLLNRDNNIRYVALNTLCKVVNRDTQAIQRHRNTVVDCLKDPDISIRRRALDLIYALVTKANVKALVKELLNYLSLTSGDEEFKSDLTDKICRVVDRFAPSRRWQIDTMINVLSTAGNFTAVNVATDLILLISQSKDLYPYSVHKLYVAVKKTLKHNTQLPLLHVGVWCIGEYGEHLTTKAGAEKANVDGKSNFAPILEGKILDTLERVMKTPVASLTTREYALNALVKLTSRLGEELQERLGKLIATYKTSISLELQQRSCEYSALMSPKLKAIRSSVVGRMPVSKIKKKKPEEKTGPTDGVLSQSPKRSPKTMDNPKISELEKEAPLASKEKGKTTKDKDKEKEKEKDKDKEKEGKVNGLEDEEEPDDEPKEPAKPKPKKKEETKAKAPTEKPPPPTKATTQESLFPNFLDDSESTPTKSTTQAKTTEAGLLDDIFSGTGFNPDAYKAPEKAKAAPVGEESFLEMFETTLPTPTPVPTSLTSIPTPIITMPTPIPTPIPTMMPTPVFTPVSTSGSTTFAPVAALSEDNLNIIFTTERKSTVPEVYRMVCTFTNAGSVDMNDFELQIAVPPYMKIVMDTPSSRTISSNHSPVTQSVNLFNNDPKKKMKIKAKIQYSVSGSLVAKERTFAKFW